MMGVESHLVEWIKEYLISGNEQIFNLYFACDILGLGILWLSNIFRYIGYCFITCTINVTQRPAYLYLFLISPPPELGT